MLSFFRDVDQVGMLVEADSFWRRVPTINHSRKGIHNRKQCCAANARQHFRFRDAKWL